MSNERQLLERHRARALVAIAERLDMDPADLRSLGVDDVLRLYGEACAHVPFDVDTGEIGIAPAPEGWADDEITQPMRAAPTR